MANSQTSAASSGIGFGGLLAIVFITLKLCHVIDWSWWWVLCPLWIPLAFVLSIVVILAVVGFMAVVLK